MLTEKVPKNIRKFRELRDHTREEMAALLEMSPSGYAKIEQGIVDVSIRKIELISKILKVEVKQIMEFEVNQVFDTPKKNSNRDIDNNRAQTDHSKKDIFYLEKLVQSLERENEMLRQLLKKDT